jgi:predicted transcriptional regulator
MYNLKSITTIKVLYKLLEASNFNKISTTRRQTICKELGISDTSFSKALRSLIELNIFSGEKGTYAINAEIF